jgi:hypothetical protein
MIGTSSRKSYIENITINFTPGTIESRECPMTSGSRSLHVPINIFQIRWRDTSHILTASRRWGIQCIFETVSAFGFTVINTVRSMPVLHATLSSGPATARMCQFETRQSSTGHIRIPGWRVEPRSTAGSGRLLQPTRQRGGAP